MTKNSVFLHIIRSSLLTGPSQTTKSLSFPSTSPHPQRSDASTPPLPVPGPLSARVGRKCGRRRTRPRKGPPVAVAAQHHFRRGPRRPLGEGQQGSVVLSLSSFSLSISSSSSSSSSCFDCAMIILYTIN